MRERYCRIQTGHPGDKLGPYEILAPYWQRRVARSISCPWHLNRDVAIKVSGAQFSERFEREAIAFVALNHPNIWQTYDAGPNSPVMQYRDGAPNVSP